MDETMNNLLERHLYGELRESLDEKLSVIRLADLGGVFTEAF